MDPWDPAWTWRQQLRAVYHTCPCFPTNSFLPRVLNKCLLTLHLCQHFFQQCAQLILFWTKFFFTFEERKWWREESYFVSMSVFQVMALWLVLEEEITWLSAVLMKYGRYHLDLLCGLAEKCVPSFCSFGGLQAGQRSVIVFSKEWENALQNLTFSSQRCSVSLLLTWNLSLVEIIALLLI